MPKVDVSTIKESAWVDTEEIEFGEPPARARNAANASLVAELKLASTLREHQGEWAKISIFPLKDRRLAAQRATTIRTAKRAAWMEGRWDARIGEAKDGSCIEVWVSYIGPDEKGTKMINVAGRLRKQLPDGTILGARKAGADDDEEDE